MAEAIESARLFTWGVIKRFYVMLPTALVDPFDLLNVFFGIEYRPNSWVAWPVFSAGLFVAGAWAYHDLRSATNGPTSAVAEALASLSDTTRQAFLKQADVFRRGRVGRADVRSDVLEELRRIGFVEVKTADAGWWSRDRHKGTIDWYYLTPSGGSALNRLLEDAQDEIEDLIERLRKTTVDLGSRRLRLDEVLLERGNQLATGMGISDIPGGVAAEFQIAGVVRVELVQGVSSPAQSIPTPPQNYYYLTDLGARVLSRLREQQAAN